MASPQLPVPTPQAKPRYITNPFTGGAQALTGIPGQTESLNVLPPSVFEDARRRLEQFYNKLDPVVPQGTPGGGTQRMLQQVVQGVATPAFGVADLGLLGAQGIASIPDFLGNVAAEQAGVYFGDKYVDPRTTDLQASKELPVEVKLPNFAAAQGQPGAPNVMPFMAGLDGTTEIPGGRPIPAPPTLSAPAFPTPDYTKQDAHLAAARPKPQMLRGSESDAGWGGAAMAAAQIDPYETNWAQALAMVAAGRSEGLRTWKLQQDEMDMRNEAEARKYEMTMAGVAGDRATFEAQQHYNRLKMEQDVLQQNWENSLKHIQATSPSVQANADGSLIITQRNPDGTIKVTKQGYDEVLQTELALAQAKAVGGKSAELGFERHLLQSGNYQMALGLRLNKLIGMPGGFLEAELLPQGSPLREAYIKDVQEHRTQLQAQFADKKIFEYMDLQYRYNNMNRILFSSQDTLNNAVKTLGIGTGVPMVNPYTNTAQTEEQK